MPPIFCIKSAVCYEAERDGSGERGEVSETYPLENIVRQLVVLLVLFGSLASLASTNVLDHGGLVGRVLLRVGLIGEQRVEVSLVGGIHARVDAWIGWSFAVVLVSPQRRDRNGVLCEERRTVRGDRARGG